MKATTKQRVKMFLLGALSAIGVLLLVGAADFERGDTGRYQLVASGQGGGLHIIDTQTGMVRPATSPRKNADQVRTFLPYGVPFMYDLNSSSEAIYKVE
jgi:hypothetical protein